ncbi:MAG: hypothetical protein QXK76_03540 [Candidatus Woesearchaeota archaeon]
MKNLKKTIIYLSLLFALNNTYKCTNERNNFKEYREKTGIIKIDANSNISAYGLGLYAMADKKTDLFSDEEFNYKIQENIIWKGKYHDAFSLWVEGEDSAYFKMFIDRGQNGIINEEITGTIPNNIYDLNKELSYPEILPEYDNPFKTEKRIIMKNLDSLLNKEQMHISKIINNYIDKIN